MHLGRSRRHCLFLFYTFSGALLTRQRRMKVSVRISLSIMYIESTASSSLAPSTTQTHTHTNREPACSTSHILQYLWFHIASVDTIFFVVVVVAADNSNRFKLFLCLSLSHSLEWPRKIGFHIHARRYSSIYFSIISICVVCSTLMGTACDRIIYSYGFSVLR